MVTRPVVSTKRPRARRQRPRHRIAKSSSALLVLSLAMTGLTGLGLGAVIGTTPSASAAPLPSGTYCEGPKPDQPVAGPTKVVMVELENESSSSISGSPDAPFENGTLSAQCGNFATSAMHSTTHPSESNYFAEVSGLNAAINSGADAQARFGLSDCPPDSTNAVCTYGGGHFASSVPSIYSQVEAKYGVSGWKSYSDDMLTNCEKRDDNVYATTPTATYRKYVTKHNPAVYFDGIACATQDVPSGDWKHGQGVLYNDIVNGTLPPYTYLQPNDIDNGHDPVAVNGVTVAGGKSQIANIDNYLSSMMALIQGSPDYQSGNLVVIITFDEGTKAGPIAGEGAVGENCADPDISPLATSCQVQTWLVGRYVPSYMYTGYMNQFGLLAATQRILGLSPLLGHAADASTPDIVNGTVALPDPFNLQPNGTPPPPTVPGSPTGLTATSGAASVALAWSAPTSTGGQALTDYLIEQRETGSASWTAVSRAASTATFATVSGLVNGTSYDFRVSAINPVGPSAPSATVTSVPGASGPELLPDPGFETGLGGWTPFSVGTMTRVSSPVRSGLNALSIAATSTTASKVGMGQNSAGAKSVAGTVYTAQCWVQPVSSPNLTIQIHFVEYTSTFSSYILLSTTSIPKLPTGVWTLVKVSSTAVNSNERMIPQIYSTNQTTTTGGILYDDCSLTTGAGAPVVTVPGAPTGVTATASAKSASVAFTVPTSTGGAPISSYRVTASPGGATATGTSSPITVPGLTNGTAYTFTVTATNSAGTGPASAPSASATPADSPDAPGAPTATPGDASVALTWNAPAANGSPLTGYVVQYSVSGAANWVPVSGPTGTSRSVTVSGLANDTSYDFHVAAVNAIGESDFSDITAATPSAVLNPPPTVPDAPTSVSAVAGNRTAVVTFNAPASDGGGAITGYTVTSAPGGLTASGASSPITVTGLTNGTAYTFTVTARNSVGTGAPSAATSAVTPYVELLPDGGFETGLGGWVPFSVGTLTRVTTPASSVRTGSTALNIAAVGATASKVGMTQNSVVAKSVAGATYTAQCWVQPTSANLTVQIHFVEYTSNFSSYVLLGTTSIPKLTMGTWTLVRVSSVAVNSNERMIPQIYSTNETTGTGSILYDDCSVTSP